MARARFKYDRALGVMVNAETGEPTGTVEQRKPINFTKRVHFARDYADYDCPVTGRRISGKAEHEANLKRHGVRVIEKGERQDAERQLQYRREEMGRRIDRTVNQLAREIDL